MCATLIFEHCHSDNWLCGWLGLTLTSDGGYSSSARIVVRLSCTCTLTSLHDSSHNVDWPPMATEVSLEPLRWPRPFNHAQIYNHGYSLIPSWLWLQRPVRWRLTMTMRSNALIEIPLRECLSFPSLLLRWQQTQYITAQTNHGTFSPHFYDDNPRRRQHRHRLTPLSSPPPCLSQCLHYHGRCMCMCNDSCRYGVDSYLIVYYALK
jgi:hypothetical protein